MTRTIVDAHAAPAAIGPYSHAATAPGAGLLYLSGQTPNCIQCERCGLCPAAAVGEA